MKQQQKTSQNISTKQSGIDTRVIRVTPAGRGAVASLLLVGDDVRAVIEPFLHSPPSVRECFPPNPGAVKRPIFAYFQLPRTDSREEVVLYFRQNDRLELHCHGGDAVVGAIENALVENGASRQSWDAWLGECDEAVEKDLALPEARLPEALTPEAVRRDALRLLPFAETERTARLLWSQFHGALSRRIRWLINSPVAESLAAIDSLLDTYALGRHLVTPFRIGLIGAVNAGKSSLMNALLGFNRSITSTAAGTTRDAVSAQTVLDGWPVMLVDTAGLRETANPIEREGISRAQAVMADSDLILHVIDASDPASVDASALSDGLTKPAQESPHVRVFNKIDLIDRQTEAALTAMSDANAVDTVFVSAKTGAGIDRLCRVLVMTLCRTGTVTGESHDLPLVFTESQYAALIRLRDAQVSRQ